MLSVVVYTSARMVSYEVLRDKVTSGNRDGKFPIGYVVMHSPYSAIVWYSQRL